MKTPEGQALRRWQEVKPEQFRDERTFQTDWAAYDKAKEAALGELPGYIQVAMKQRLFSVDPQVRQVEAQYRQARQALRELPPKYRNMDEAGAQRLDRFVAAVDDEAARLTYDAASSGRRLNQAAVGRRLAQEMARGEGDRTLAILYNQLQTPAGRNRLLNPAYSRYIFENEDILRPFYPDLFSKALLERVGVLPEEMEVIQMPRTPRRRSGGVRPISAAETGPELVGAVR